MSESLFTLAIALGTLGFFLHVLEDRHPRLIFSGAAILFVASIGAAYVW